VGLAGTEVAPEADEVAGFGDAGQSAAERRRGRGIGAHDRP